jgi:hypothetical protein
VQIPRAITHEKEIVADYNKGLNKLTAIFVHKIGIKTFKWWLMYQPHQMLG